MASGRFSTVAMALVAGLLVLSAALGNAPSRVEAWGEDGHAIVCEIAKSLLNTSAAAGIKKLLPKSANGNMSSVCSWADEVRETRRYVWSAPLHFIDTPDQACTYDYTRDCVGDSKPNFCSAGAINNYTAQLSGTSGGSYNLTEALLFLIHIVGDIHQPLHCGFKGDLGGNDIDVKWYNLTTNLHHWKVHTNAIYGKCSHYIGCSVSSMTNSHLPSGCGCPDPLAIPFWRCPYKVWDTPLITTTYKDFFKNKAANLASAILQNITSVWSSDAVTWSTCSTGLPPCTETYATESVTLACSAAYANVNGEVTAGTTLADPYFLSRYPVVERRLAMGGVRLAAILNTIFQEDTLGLKRSWQWEE